LRSSAEEVPEEGDETGTQGGADGVGQEVEPDDAAAVAALGAVDGKAEGVAAEFCLHFDVRCWTFDVPLAAEAEAEGGSGACGSGDVIAVSLAALGADAVGLRMTAVHPACSGSGQHVRDVVFFSRTAQEGIAAVLIEDLEGFDDAVEIGASGLGGV
jgi:hypothetical protein